MSNTTARRALSFLIVGAMVLAGLFVLVTAAPVASARAIDAPAAPTTGVTSSPLNSAVPSTLSNPAEQSDSWRMKLDSSLRDIAVQGSKDLQSVVIYTDDMNALAPLLAKYGVQSLPEEFRGQSVRSEMRLPTTAQGIVSTAVSVPASALSTIANLPGVLGIDANNRPAPADFTNFDLTTTRQQLNAFRAKQSALPPSDISPADWGIVQAHHAPDAWPIATGAGVNIAVQDWGTDFAHPNLYNPSTGVGRWAVDSNPASPYFGYPIMHSQFSLWNELALFTASSDLDRAPYPTFFSFGASTWFTDTSYRATASGTGTLRYATGFTYGFLQLTNRVAPTWTSCPGAGTRISRTYTVGTAADSWAIPSASGWYHLGVNKDQYLEGIHCERPGILVTDSTTPGVYDKVYVDLNDDYNFTNDKPVSIADPISGLDINADGFYDISGGLLYFVAKQTNAISGEVVIASATGTETSASLAHGWVQTDVDGTNLATGTLALNGAYWPSATEDIFEEPISSAIGNEQGTTYDLTTGFNAMTGATVGTAALLAAGYPVSFIWDFSGNSTGPLTAGVDYSINMATGRITWLRNFPVGEVVDIIYQLKTWTLNYDSGKITFNTPPTTGAAVTATYNTGLPVPYANITAQRQGWDLFVPGPGDLVAFYGSFALGEEHGTWVSTDLAGNPVGNAGGLLDVYGTAPNVKIVGVDLPTSLDVAELFYFSSHGYDGIPNTGDEANIATNSWGYTRPQETGFTNIERYLYDLTTHQVPNFSILFAAGNNGPGYSTSTPPNTAPGVITVGGGTNMNYRTIFGFDGGQAYCDFGAFGSCIHGAGPYGEPADFTSKGPTVLGTPEPDVYATAEFGLGGRPLNSACLAFGCDGLGAWDLWAGTSMSTPVTAGVVSLIYQAFRSASGGWPTSTQAKEILMSSADDFGYDVLQQGAGWVNASAAVKLAKGVSGVYVDPSFVTPGSFGGVHRPAFVNQMLPGASATSSLTVHNPTASDVTVTIGDAMYTKIAPDYTFTWNFQAAPGVRDWRVLKPSGLYGADGLTLIDAHDISAGWNAADFIRINFVRDPTVLTAAPDTFIESFDWYNYAAHPSATPGFDRPYEQNRFAFGSRGGSDTFLQLRDPKDRVDDGLGISFRDFAGAHGLTPVTVEFYGKASWAWATPAVSSLLVPAGSSASFNVDFAVPAGTTAGMYQGVIWVNDGSKSSLVPVLITVPATSLPLKFGGGVATTDLYDNNAVTQGQLPGNWRQIGDSRLFWADFSAAPATNRRMIYDLLLNTAPSEGEITIYSLKPDPVWTDDATYGPGTMVELATTKEILGATDTLYLNKEFLQTAVLSGPIAIQVKALNSVSGSEPFSLDAGIMETNPTIARISTNKLAGSVPITVTSQVPLQDGLGTAVTEIVVTHANNQPVASYPYPGGSFIAYLYASTNRVETVIPSGTIVATWSAFFHSGANDVDFGIFYDSNCDGVYTVADSAVGTTMATSNNPEQASLSFPATGCYWVHAAGFDVAPTGGLFDLTLTVNKIGVSPFKSQNAPSTTVPAFTPTGFNISWDFPGSHAEGLLTSFLFASPGFAPFALAQQITIRYSYDITPPSFSSQLPAQGSVVSDSTPGMFVQINDNQPGAFEARGEIDQTKIRVWLDGVDITSIASISVPHQTNVGYPTGTVLFTPTQPLSDGSHTMIVQAGDFAGNLATTAWSFAIDTTAPRLDISSPTPGLVTSASTVTVTGVTEPGASVSIGGSSVSVDGSGAFSSAVSLIEGSNTIDVSASDALGNTASTSLTVVSDSTAPAISLLRSSAGLLTSKDLTVVSGVVSEAASLTVAGIPAMVHADGSFEVPVSLVEGSNSIAIVATDAAGNQGTASLTVARDTTPPTLTIDALPSEVSSATVTVSGTVESSIAFVTVNGQPVTVSAGRYSTSVALSFGSNVIFVEATDAAGNTATTSRAVSYVPQGVTTASVGLILLPVLTVIALLAGLAIGQARKGRGGGGGGGGEGGMKMEEMKKEEGASAEEELPPPDGGEL